MFAQPTEFEQDAAGTVHAEAVEPSHRLRVTLLAIMPAVSIADEVMTYPAGADTRRLQPCVVDIVYEEGIRIVMPVDDVPSARVFTFGAVTELHIA